MSEYQEFTGRTVEEALRSARDAFGVSGLDDLDFEILTPGSRGVLGMGAEPARIIAAPRSALGGAAPRREAASATPLPAPPPREERRDRGPRESRYGGRERAPREDRRPAPREASGFAGEGQAPTAPSPAAGAARPPREERRGRDRGPRGDRRGTGLSQREAAEVESARAGQAIEREEIQAAEASAEALAAGKEILDDLLGLMGYRAAVAIHTGGTSRLDVSGADEAEREALGALIGRKGERLSALQHLVNLMLSRRMGAWTRVLVDVEDYRGRRERQLVELARRASERVVATGTMLQLEPMPALERRWIHMALRDVPGVATQSIGEEPQRRVVIVPEAG
jgi:spoIIIJ-associated protein